MKNIDYFMDKKKREFEDFKARSQLVIVADGKYLTDGIEIRFIERSAGVFVGKHYVASDDTSCPFDIL